jgi:hypothetical protein
LIRCGTGLQEGDGPSRASRIGRTIIVGNGQGSWKERLEMVWRNFLQSAGTSSASARCMKPSCLRDDVDVKWRKVALKIFSSKSRRDRNSRIHLFSPCERNKYKRKSTTSREDASTRKSWFEFGLLMHNIAVISRKAPWPKHS